MKKTTKKLSLNRETVRELDQSALDQAQGGYPTIPTTTATTIVTHKTVCE